MQRNITEGGNDVTNTIVSFYHHHIVFHGVNPPIYRIHRADFLPQFFWTLKCQMENLPFLFPYIRFYHVYMGVKIILKQWNLWEVIRIVISNLHSQLLRVKATVLF